MSKNKWTIIPFIIIASLILALIFFFTLHKPLAPVEPLKAIPINASLVIKVNRYNAFFEKTSGSSALWNELKHIPGFGKIDRQMRFLDSIFRFVPDAGQILKNTPSFISAHFTGRDNISFMHVFQLPPRFNENKVRDLISGFTVNSGTMSTRDYEGVSIYEVTLLNESLISNFSWAVTHDILLISFSTIVLEDAIRQVMAGESLADLDGFSEIYATAGKNVDANVFVNFQQFPRSLSTFVRPDFKAEIRSFKSFARWAEMDVNLLSDMLLMNGFVNPPDSVASIASIFVNQSPQRITADEILPGSVASFLTVTFSDAGQYFNDYRAYLQEQGKLTAWKNTLQSLTGAYNTDFLQEFTDILDNEITLALDASNQDMQQAAMFFLMRVKSGAQAEEKLNDITAKIAASEAKSPAVYRSDFRFDSELTFRIHYWPVRKLTAKIFGDLFAGIDEHYFVIIDNYLVFSSSPGALRSLIRNQVLNKTLQNDFAYKDFKNNLSPRSNIYFYCNLSKGNLVYSDYLVSSLAKNWEKYIPVFQKVQVMGFQLYSNNKMLYNNFLLKYLSSYNQETRTVWESKLDTLVDFKPVFTLNHQTRQNEVFVQDMDNNIYLINQVGRILWKVQLPEPILSEVFQVDYYRNGKLQLLFSTRSHLYLIDRNGNFVDKYPVKLRSPATCGVSVFDYDNNRDYRLFIPCEDRKVYAYSREGNLLTGWLFDRTESEVSQPVNHFRITDKDFLVFGDRFKTYILDRKGNTRVNVDTFFPKSSRNGYFPVLPRDGSGTGFVTTDTTGKVYFIGVTGVVSTVELGTFTDRHFFDYKDLNGDGRYEYIFLEDNRLTVFNRDKSRAFTYDFKEPVNTRPIIYQFSAIDRKIGIVNRTENKIYLFNNNGELYSGFPLQGNTPFSIGNFGDSLARFNLVVGNRDNFLYNYRVK